MAVTIDLMLTDVAMSPEPQFFQFEADFVDSLRCIPMQVRMKLDTCGVKLKLHHWHQLQQDERQQLAAMPCNDEATAAAYRNYLQALVTRYQGSPAKTLPIEPVPAWHNAAEIPDQVAERARQLGCHVSLHQWQALQPLQRFALIKLSRPSHENRNFEPALRELGLLPSPPAS
jgi:hypothetical protein